MAASAVNAQVGGDSLLDWEWAAQFGSFIGGVAAGAGLIGLYFVYRQWRDTQDADRIAKEIRERDEETKRSEERKLVASKLADEINLSADMLLIERSKLWAQALNRFPADIVARSVLAAAAVRTTSTATSRIESALELANAEGVGADLRRSIRHALGVLQTVGKEDLTLVTYIQDYDFRFSKLNNEVVRKLYDESISEAERDMLAFQAHDGSVQTAAVFLSISEAVNELRKKVESLLTLLDQEQDAMDSDR